ncbi:PIG-L family deacetylase [Streptomyces sp. ET3-23]|uniref:PIG-L family deacetylase n=1 Tax=Streptomyces sp. ET3-23 TaxID=2885643 RepID=UPI001D102223|nr:PIG-L family deacetylase [Streptomyces sp. ET3-23]MCC2273856.1 PIG-L family deacetylase [Streptomyces sp. ET3-23]
MHASLNSVHAAVRRLRSAVFPAPARPGLRFSGPQGRGVEVSGPALGRHVQILAHPDDDLFFMAPDLFHAVAAGAEIVNVYLVAGEADGRNAAHGARNRDRLAVDYEGYVAARQRGLRAVYADAALNDASAPWTREAYRTAGGFHVERASLAGRAPVTLYFFNLAMTGGRPPMRLHTLWTGEIEQQRTRRPTGSPLPDALPDAPEVLTREGLLDALVELLAEHRPSTVRTLDPDPDHATYENGKVTYHDHQEHTAAALFAMEALRRYGEQAPEQAPVVESYRGYGNKVWPGNLSPQVFHDKTRRLDIYGGQDGRRRKHGVDPGDFQLGGSARRKAYGRSTYARYSHASTWLQRDGDGALTAFTVLNGIPVQWKDTDGEFTPRPLGTSAPEGGFFSPQVHAVATEDGLLHVFGVHMSLAAGRYEHRRDVMLVSQQEPGGRFGAWQNLGNPYNAEGLNPIKRREIGQPEPVALPGGGLEFVVRNFDRALSHRRLETTGTWSPWRDLGGTVQEGIAWGTRPDGTVELYAPAPDRIVQWNRADQSPSFSRPQPLPFPAPAGPVTYVTADQGRALLLMRRPGTGEILCHHRPGPQEPWQAEPQSLGGHGGTGPITATRTHDGRIALATRNDHGTLSFARLPEPADEKPPTWTASGPLSVHAPSSVLDADGCVVTAVLGVDARLHVARWEPGTPEPVWTAHAGGGRQMTLARMGEVRLFE